MVCSIGSGRMAAMARLLAAESVSQTTTEDVGHQKLAVQYIHRELREADESNLLDEEDMLVFGLKPVTDPLNLVCCNTCKKPLKASQYVAHAELCKSLSLVEETVLELDGGTGCKKPPRKEKKKLSTNQATLVGGREKLEPAGLHDTTSLNSRMLEQKSLTASLPIEAKDAAFVTDGSDISPAHTDNSASALLPPIKRYKMISAESLLTPDHLETANGVNKSLCISTQEAFTCGGEYLNGSRARSERTCDRVFRFHMPTEVNDCFLPTKEFPAPLATKIYYSQTSHRLRSVISDLYKASFNEHSNELLIPSGLEENVAVPGTSSSRNISHEQFDGQQEKRDACWVPSMQTPNQLLAQSADVCMDKSGGCSSFPLNNVLGSPTPPVETLRQKSQNYLSIPYSFTGNSEKPLDTHTMQLPKGSVPVI